MGRSTLSKRGDTGPCTACQAGWFLLGSTDATDIVWKDVSDTYKAALWSDTNLLCTFESGSRRIATKLGMKHPEDVESYYGARRWLWGNESGARLFCDAEAFGGATGDRIRLIDIATHWNGVAERTRRIETEMMRSERDFDSVEECMSRSSP